MQEEALLCDISACGCLRIAGTGAGRFLETMTSANIKSCVQVGDLTQGLVLSSLGEVVDVVTIVCMGDEEYLVLTTPGNTDEVCAWLDAHAKIEDDKGRVFGDAEVQDQSEHLGVLLLGGSGNEGAYAELMAACQGRFAFVASTFTSADAFGLVVYPAHLLFAPINIAPQIGDYLLQVEHLEPIDLDSYIERLAEKEPSIELLKDVAYHKPAELGLERFMRPDGAFVGAHALDENS